MGKILFICILMFLTIFTHFGIAAESTFKKEFIPGLPRLTCPDLFQIRDDVLEIYDERMRSQSMQEDLHKRHPHPISALIPPSDLQYGGRDIFQSLFSVATLIQRSGSEVESYGQKNVLEKVFVNQTLDLDLVGPATALTFAGDTDGNFAFAFSHGRSRYSRNNGSLVDLDFNDSEGMGRFPWPRDSQLHYLPGRMLFETNGVHSDLSSALNAFRKFHGRPEPEDTFGGALTVGSDGRIQIVYISGILNSVNSLDPDDQWIGSQNNKAMSRFRRTQFHLLLLKAFSGRNLTAVVDKAPVDREDIEYLEAVSFFPNFLAIPEESIQVHTPRDLIHSFLGADGFAELFSVADDQFWTPFVDDYFSNLTPKEIDTVVHRDIVEYMIMQKTRFFERVEFYYAMDEVVEFIENLMSRPWNYTQLKGGSDLISMMNFSNRDRPIPVKIVLAVINSVFADEKIFQVLDPIDRSVFLLHLMRTKKLYKPDEVQLIYDSLQERYLSQPWAKCENTPFEQNIIKMFISSDN